MEHSSQAHLPPQNRSLIAKILNCGTKFLIPPHSRGQSKEDYLPMNPRTVEWILRVGESVDLRGTQPFPFDAKTLNITNISAFLDVSYGRLYTNWWILDSNTRLRHVPFNAGGRQGVWRCKLPFFLLTMFAKFSRLAYRLSRIRPHTTSFLVVGTSTTLVCLASLAAERRTIRCDDSLQLSSERDEEEAREAFPGAFHKPRWTHQDYLSADSIFASGPIWYAGKDIGLARCDALSVSA